MGKKKQKIVPTKLDVFSTQFDVDTPRFLKEVIENSDCKMYGECWNIFRSLLVQVTQRATELNDPILNVLMLRLNLYEVPNEERHKIIEQIRKEIENDKQDKQLLFKDLCARLPYGVKIQVYYEDIAGSGYFDETVWLIDNDEPFHVNDRWIENIKPYLRPISSMTEEEKNEFIHYAGYEVEESVNGRHYEYYLKDFVGTPEKPSCNCDAIDWLNARHFDYRGLIEKGLALEAPEGMYN